ncbi:MAG: hypothetical protein WDW36_003982 [Sanguina aurantia]
MHLGHQQNGGRSTSDSGFLGKLKLLDAYASNKIADDFFTKTMSGGVITIAATVVMVLLFLSEIRLYVAVNTHHELSVDTSRGETIAIHVDVTFPKMPCAWLSLDAMDISGDLHLDVDHDVYKQRLGASGSPVKAIEKHDVVSTKKMGHSLNETCGSCYGSEDKAGDCCNSCDEVRSAYRKKGWALTNTDHIEQCSHDGYLEAIKEQQQQQQQQQQQLGQQQQQQQQQQQLGQQQQRKVVGEGCRMWGDLEVNKVAGNFHFAPGRSYQQGSMHVHDIAPFGDAVMDLSHTINRLAFGAAYPGMRNPLDLAKVSQASLVKSLDGSGMYQYFLKVVPTQFTTLSNTSLNTNQYSVTENFREAAGGAQRSLPGVFFFYDMSPIKVKIYEDSRSFLHFLTNVCAIVGGVFTVSGILDACIYQSERMIRKKMEIGKFG